MKDLYLSRKYILIANEIFLAELNQWQKQQVDKYTQKRDKNLSFGNMFNNQRTYFNIKKSTLKDIEIPVQINKVIDKYGYYCPDYRQGYVYKKDDKLKSKPIRLVKILRKDQKFQKLKKQFDERLKSNRKENIQCLICITHNPYDVAGMSTDRNWTSCMNLQSGTHRTTALKQVRYGGMCAYLIKKEDKNIQQPIARIAIKRLISDYDNSFMFVSQNVIYGDIKFAEQVNFNKEVIKLLEESNNSTMKETSIIYHRDDDGSYSDSNITNKYNFKNDKQLYQFIEQNPNRINLVGLIDSLTNQQINLVFDFILDKRTDYVYLLCINNKLNKHQIYKFIDAIIEKHNFDMCEKIYNDEKNISDEHILYMIKKLIYDNKFSVIVKLLFSVYSRNKIRTYVLEYLFENKRISQLYDLFPALYENEQNNFINMLIENKDQSTLNLILHQKNINQQFNKTIISWLIKNAKKTKVLFDLIVNYNLQTNLNNQILNRFLYFADDSDQIFYLLQNKKITKNTHIKTAINKLINQNVLIYNYNKLYKMMNDQSILSKTDKNYMINRLKWQNKFDYDNASINISTYKHNQKLINDL